MASVKYTGNVDFMTGKVNGWVYGRNKYTNYVRSRSKPLNPKTNFQLAVRDAFKSIVKKWRTLSQLQRDGWDLLGKDVTFSNKLGDSKTYTGFNVFGKLNMQLNAVQEAPLDDAPDNVNVPNFSSISFDVDCTPGSEDIKFIFAPVIAAGKKVILYSTGKVSAGIKTPSKTQYKQFSVVDDTFLTNSSVKTAWTNVFGNVPNAGSIIFFMAKIVDVSSGFSSLVLTTRSVSAI